MTESEWQQCQDAIRAWAERHPTPKKPIMESTSGRTISPRQCADDPLVRKMVESYVDNGNGTLDELLAAFDGSGS